MLTIFLFIQLLPETLCRGCKKPAPLQTETCTHPMETFIPEQKPLVKSRPKQNGPISWVVTFTRVSSNGPPREDTHLATSNITFFQITVTLIISIFLVFPVKHVVKLLEDYYPNVNKPFVHLAMAFGNGSAHSTIIGKKKTFSGRTTSFYSVPDILQRYIKEGGSVIILFVIVFYPYLMRS